MLNEGEQRGVAQATPRPWKVPTHAQFQVTKADALPGEWVLAVTYPDRHSGRSVQEANANAELIVRAVNAHDDLVHAAESVVAIWDKLDDPDITTEEANRLFEVLEDCENSLRANLAKAKA